MEIVSIAWTNPVTRVLSAEKTFKSHKISLHCHLYNYLSFIVRLHKKIMDIIHKYFCVFMILNDQSENISSTNTLCGQRREKLCFFMLRSSDATHTSSVGDLPRHSELSSTLLMINKWERGINLCEDLCEICYSHGTKKKREKNHQLVMLLTRPAAATV